MSYFPAVIGGLLIGFSAALMWRLNGRIAGISGIFRRCFSFERSDHWAIFFILGLILAPLGLIYFGLHDAPTSMDELDIWRLVLGGLLVGFGVRLGGGCTSGHGVCGMSRMSARSFVATFVFMAMGIATVALYTLFGA